MKGRVVLVVFAMMAIPVSALFVPSSEANLIVGWQDAGLVENYGPYSAYGPQSATDGEGNVMAVWLQTNGSGPSVFACRYSMNEGWLEAESLENSDADVRAPTVAMNENGDAVAVWRQANETTSNWDIWGALYSDGVGWADAEPISADGLLDDDQYRAVIDSSGIAAVIWKRSGAPNHVLISRGEVGTGWSVAEQVDESATADSMSPSIGIDGNDNLIVVWIQYELSEASVWTKRFDAGEGWDAPEKLSDTGEYGQTVISVNDGGRAICAWSHQNDSTSTKDIFSSVYNPGVGWDDLIMSGHDADKTHLDPRVAIDQDGNAVLAWCANSVSKDYVFCRFYEVGIGWGDRQSLAESPWDMEFYPPSPKVAMNNEGEIICIFYHYDGEKYNLRGMAYSPAEGWTPSTLISTDNLGDVSPYYSVTINEDGSGMAVWDQDDSTKSDVWYAEYLALDDTPPSVVIESPEDGESVETSVIAVTGWTEPGVSLVINGMVVSVEADGSFSCNILLTEGDNHIVATATDAAGNSANASVTVTCEAAYDSLLEDLNETMDDLLDAQEDLDDANGRIDSLESNMVLLGVAVAAFALISIVALAMYLGLRRKVQGNVPSEDSETPPPPEE